MNKTNIITILLFISSNLFAADQLTAIKNPNNKKGSFYTYWGWNHDKYTKSNLHFIGTDYDFTLKKVKAVDRQSPMAYDPYLRINQITIPQYNFRIGYFLTNNINISIGADHMKYVMVQNQTVKIDGNIANSGTKYDGIYYNSDINLTKDFLKFEHTDGLNYLNTEVNKFGSIKEISKNLNFNYTFGIGAGVLYPRSDVTLLNNARNDKFHIAGYGISTKAGLNFTFFKYFFIQPEFKIGFINLPDIRTTMYKRDKAKQQFGFMQGIAVFGFCIPTFN